MGAEGIIGQLVLNGIIMGVIFSLVGSGMTFILGVARVLNIAHGAFYMLGGYVTIMVISLMGVNPIYSLPIIMLLMLLIGFFTQRVIVEPISESVDAVIIATYGLAFFLEGFVLIAFGPGFKGVSPILEGNTYGLGLYIRNQNLIAAAFSIMILASIAIFLKTVKIGKAIRAVAEDRETAMIMGIEVTHISMLSFGIGIAIVGAASALLSSVFPVFPAAGWKWLLMALVIVTVGGMGSIKGSLVAGLIYGMVDSFLQFLLPQMTVIGLLVVLILIITIRPSGLFGKVIERV